MNLEEILGLLTLACSSNLPCRASLSKPLAPNPRITREKWRIGAEKVEVERYSATQAFQEGFPFSELRQRLDEALSAYGQCLLRAGEWEIQILCSSSGKRSFLPKRPIALSPDRPAPIRLEQARAMLTALGIMDSGGRIIDAKRAKYRQICRFIELVADLGLEAATDGPLRVVDFGCGKSYLSFALYQYLAVERAMPLRMRGIDAKSELISFCSDLAGRLNLGEGLCFTQADIASCDTGPIDLAISLHACDVATDIALAKAAAAGARYIMCVPCCQHELFGQIDSGPLRLMLRYGLVKERLASLATDCLRASLMRVLGYSVDVLEFTDPENSPKNIMLRCARPSRPDRDDVRLDARRSREWSDYLALRDFLGVRPSLEPYLREAGLLPSE